jgi:Uma2 family endonuclease
VVPANLTADFAAPPITSREWDALVIPESYRAEIIRGELVVTPAVSMAHARAESRLTVALAAAVPTGYEVVSGADWKLVVDAVVAMAPIPDLMVVGKDQSGPLVRPPLLAVEILSPADHHRLLRTDMTRIEGKRADYAANGLKDYLEVDLTTPAPTAASFELREGALVEAARASGTQVLRAKRPFPYQVIPADLVAG